VRANEIVIRYLSVKRTRTMVRVTRPLHDCSGCFRLERLPGGACTHWKAPPCHGAHVNRSFGGAMALSAALIGVQYPDKESQFLTEGSGR
jgi:hypothetical protein